jgi:hypothetical protein
VQAEEMKLTRRVLWFLIALGFALGSVGFFYAYYFSWIVSTPGVPEEARKHYDSIARMIGVPSLILLCISLVTAAWLMVSKKPSKA